METHNQLNLFESNGLIGQKQIGSDALRLGSAARLCIARVVRGKPPKIKQTARRFGVDEIDVTQRVIDGIESWCGIA